MNADPDVGDEQTQAEARKRRRRDEEIRKGVDEYTVRLPPIGVFSLAIDLSLCSGIIVEERC